MTQIAIVYFTIDAVKMWSKCKSTIDHSLKQGAFELSGSFEQMIEEEIKWEYIYQIEFLMRVIMLTPIASQLLASLLSVVLSKTIGLTSKTYVVTITFLVVNIAIYCLSQYFLTFTYEEKYTAYRHYFERQQSDLEIITLSLLKLIGLAFTYLVVFNVTLIYFAEMIEWACGQVLFSVDKWIMEDDEIKEEIKK